ncbi:LOW QUALITY PROTEIN: uncharacterized protein LOC120151197 [Hibiscus syriacus]|uniref:LOW QUALITY PROTEIN: uncharacterized protein LOC120151197 n=1 Tax=Hibiscus syriacus TaxID=106335 RepID=UPI0019241E3C|nr:LOW QUALITY PROTEIN: uncharacterized protein LOC120151197 [Hibiscus syriacus]
MGSLNGQSNHSSFPSTHDCLLERITTLLSRWHGLQMAIRNQWGGHPLVFSWFLHSKAHQIEDLENLLRESMLLSLNTEIEDGSIEAVAEQLMIMHEEYLHGNR